MRCKSVACIWSDSPPVHKVTAATVLSHPPTLYTGGSDGSIIWWNLPTSTLPNQEVKPVALLCGHAAAIVDLGICLPNAVPVDGKLDNFSTSSSFNLNSYGALISACKDGTLCVWSRASGHCSRRRRLPPWAGSPSMLRTLPENRRYVCIACSDSDHQSLDDEVRCLSDRDTHKYKSSKGAVVIVDSYTLSIVQTVFHGNLSIGPLRCMAIALSNGDMENMSIILIDSFSRVQHLPISKDSDKNVGNVSDMKQSSSQLEIKDWPDVSEVRDFLVGCACRGHVLVLIYATYCTFRLVDNGDKIGEIVFLDNRPCEGDTRITGGLFLGDDENGMTQTSGELEYSFSVEFAVWNNRGSAYIYRTSYSSNVFKFQLLSSIPAVPLPPDVALSTCFVNACNYLLSVHSVGLHVGQSLMWKPHITAWLLPEQPDQEDSTPEECILFGEGRFSDDWRLNYSLRFGQSGDTLPLGTILPQHMSNNRESASSSDKKYLYGPEDNLVSSSMVISENCYAPSAIVYGYYNGTIEVLRFDMYFEEFSSYDGNLPESFPPSKLCLLGHTGAVLCLAAHRMVGMGGKANFNHVLVSGGIDCTVRIWDLDSGKPVIAMHQHVAAVRQILLPPPQTDYPWIDCFISVAEDSCVALTSLETLRVERMFPGHPYYPAKVVWDSIRGYVACLCLNNSGTLDTLDLLYIWDVKTGARERVIRGPAAHSMLDHFCTGVKDDSSSFPAIHKNTSASSLTLPVLGDTKTLGSNLNYPVKENSSKNNPVSKSLTGSNFSMATGKGTTQEPFFQSNRPIVECSCPFPGIATLSFDLKSMISLCQSDSLFKAGSFTQKPTHSEARTVETPKSNMQVKDDISKRDLLPENLSPHRVVKEENPEFNGTLSVPMADSDWILLFKTCLVQFSLSLLHLWNVDDELDELLVTEMKLKRPSHFNVASGLIGDRGSLTLSFPGSYATLELWKSSSEYCAKRSLTMVSLAQQMVTLVHSCSASSSALAAFYTRNIYEKIPDVKPPLLQLLVSFWQDELEHVKMGARTLFHCAASRAIPHPLRSQKAPAQTSLFGDLNGAIGQEDDNHINQSFPNSPGFGRKLEAEMDSQTEESEILSWLDSVEMQDWISCVGGTSQDAITSHVIVAAALTVWYPSLVKASLSALTVQPLVKLVMAMNENYSSTAAEILAEGMESTWKPHIAPDIPHMIGDIFFQIEHVSSAPAKASLQNSAAFHIKETLVGVLLPSLAMADLPGFLNVIESQIWSTASDSLVHVVSLMTLNRVVRGSPRKLAQYLDKAVGFILQTMDPSNAVMRRTCIQSAMKTLKELVRVFPMVALNDTSTRLAVGDAISEIKSSCVRVYDMESMAKVKVLDASGPPGLPNLIGGTSEMAVMTAISALCFSMDGEGLVAFSENGLMIRWWSLGSVWWEKISRNLTPVQCTKVIFVPPWEGFSPNCTRSSIMASALSDDGRFSLQDERRASGEIDRLKLLIHNLDLSYRLEWVAEKKVKLTQHGRELVLAQESDLTGNGSQICCFFKQEQFQVFAACGFDTAALLFHGQVEFKKVSQPIRRTKCCLHYKQIRTQSQYAV